MNFRNATLADLDEITAIESICFSANEAASRESFSDRIKTFPNHFRILEDEGKMIGFINGMVTNNKTIKDEMFQNAQLHDENGQWQSIFGLAVKPDFRRRGHAEQLLNDLIEISKKENRTGITLTCKKYLTDYYLKFGFEDLGISGSVHGGEVWHDMILTF